MRRREFIALVGGATVGCPLAGARRRARAADRRADGLCRERSDRAVLGRGVRDALAKLGWAEGSNLRIELRWGAADPDRIRTLAKSWSICNPTRSSIRSRP